MSDARGFMVAAYVLTVVVIGGYALILGTRARAARRRLETLRQAASDRDAHPSARHAPAHHHGELEAVGGTHVQA